MDFLSAALKIKDTFLKILDWALKITGQKIVPLDQYKDEAVEINLIYKSSKMLEEGSRTEHPLYDILRFPYRAS